MDFLMDYLPAIQFAAALNIGYIIPNVLEKMYNLLESINASYLDILAEVRNKTVVKNDEVSRIDVIKKDEEHTTQTAIDKLSAKLDSVKIGCDDNEKAVKAVINRFKGASGYRSLFFYSALYSIFALFLIPLSHHYNSVFGMECFFFIFSFLSLLYLVFLFIRVIGKKKDVSCHIVLWRFILFILISVVLAYLNSLFPVVIVIGDTIEKSFSSLAIVIPFLPGASCLLFVSGLIIYSIIIAKRYAHEAESQFKQINKIANKLVDFNKLIDGDISLG